MGRNWIGIYINNLKEVNDDILKERLVFREGAIANLTCAEDKKHFICFDEISKGFLKRTPKKIKSM